MSDLPARHLQSIDEEYERLSPEGKAQVDRAMRSCERREKRTEWVRVPGQKMYVDLTDWAGQ